MTIPGSTTPQNKLYDTSNQNTSTTDETSNHNQRTTRGNIGYTVMPLHLLSFENPYFVWLNNV